MSSRRPSPTAPRPTTARCRGRHLRRDRGDRGAFMAASSAPSPLYVVYQQHWGFSRATLTVVFAVYVLGLLGSLLVVGALSDHVGRRPVLAAAIALEAVALVLFLVAGNVDVLLGRPAPAGHRDRCGASPPSAPRSSTSNPPHAPGRAGVVNGVAPISGLALGALGCGALVQFAPAPTHLVFALLLGGMVLAAAGRRRACPRPRPAGRARSPRCARGSACPPGCAPTPSRSSPILVASWALGGLYLSLGPSVAASLFGLHNHLVGGLVVTLLCGTGALTAFAAALAPRTRMLRPGAVLLTAGTARQRSAGSRSDVIALAALGTVVAGIGFGAAALACFGTLARLAAAARAGRAVRRRLRHLLPGVQRSRRGRRRSRAPPSACGSPPGLRRWRSSRSPSPPSSCASQAPDERPREPCPSGPAPALRRSRLPTAAPTPPPASPTPTPNSAGSGSSANGVPAGGGPRRCQTTCGLSGGGPHRSGGSGPNRTTGTCAERRGQVSHAGVAAHHRAWPGPRGRRARPRPSVPPAPGPGPARCVATDLASGRSARLPVTRTWCPRRSSSAATAAYRSTGQRLAP